ncbi:unknown [[Mannheimia] succiniciproducens MBEL55E]|uniref:Uncharacterized protein n=1 Tax=Mannheimia succiniciproducens (strain KCTC 0769BP / MBEL55E) TaxID=221988 RepID=Q65SR9_MANSM|nr:unknown [[Mannheimia] succiniciproducens MBEL55E]
MNKVTEMFKSNPYFVQIKVFYDYQHRRAHRYRPLLQ